MVAAFMDAEAQLHISGGVITCIVGRHPTDLPGEMVTTSAIFEWKDRTDARPHAERAGDVFPVEAAAPPQREPEPVEELDDPTPDELEAHLEIHAPGVADEIGDGLDQPEEDEDVSSIPAAAR